MEKDLSIKVIREAVQKNCGGWEMATDADVTRYWDLLPNDQKGKYLASVLTHNAPAPKADVCPTCKQPMPVVPALPAADIAAVSGPVSEAPEVKLETAAAEHVSAAVTEHVLAPDTAQKAS